MAEPTAFDSPTGKGVVGVVEERNLVIGAERFMEERRVDLKDRADKLRRNGVTVIFVGMDGAAAGAFGIADPVKPSTRPALDALRAQGMKSSAFSGAARADRRLAGSVATGMQNSSAGGRPLGSVLWCAAGKETPPPWSRRPRALMR